MRVSEPKIIDVKAAAHSKCCHYWVIDTSEGHRQQGPLQIVRRGENLSERVLSSSERTKRLA